MDTSAFDMHESQARSVANHETWGQMSPSGTHYAGKIRIAVSIYDDVVVLDEKINIDGSPWWFTAVNDFASSATKEMEGGDTCEFNITVDIVTHQEPSNLNDPDFPEDDEFNEYQSIVIAATSKKYLIKTY